MRILITGLCTVHWGRLENGNIGNYYIIEASVRELHRVFPGAELVTTFQMSETFCQREKISCLPMELYYSWSEADIDNSLKELGIAYIYNLTGNLVETSPFINEVLKSDLVIDFSGEMWGDHAEPVGKNRFLVNLIKDKVAQLLNKPVVLLAGSQGPFSDNQTKEFAKEVFKSFSLVANRESTSKILLRDCGFDVSLVKSFACPAFLFEGKTDTDMVDIYSKEKIFEKDRKTIGFILCGFNFTEGPYDKWPRADEEYSSFAEAIEFIVNTLGARVVLMSHQNGFELPPKFKIIQGRDYPIVKQLEEVVIQRGNVKEGDVFCLKNPYNPWETKAIIRNFDMFISGRVHGFVAAVSQYVPTVLITRGFGKVSHRNIGFAKSVGLEDYIANPNSSEDMINKIQKCWDNVPEINSDLKKQIPLVKRTARLAFDSLRDVIYGS